MQFNTSVLSASASSLVDTDAYIFQDFHNTSNYETDSNEAIFIELEEGISEQQKSKIIDDIMKERERLSEGNIMPLATGVVITYFVIRNGNTTECELYFRINATGPINSIFWKTITVQNMNLINKETYASRSEYYRVFTAISNGTGKMFDLDIPIGETKVYMKASGIEAYAMKEAMWGRLINFNGNADIN